MKKQPQIRQQTKAKLQDAFWDLYTSKPIEKISIKEISDKANYNRGTFYLYYKDVYDIFEQIEAEPLEAIEQFVKEVSESDDVFDLTKHMGMLMELMQKYAKYAAVLLSEQGDPRFVHRLKEIIWPLLNRHFVSSVGRSAYEMSLLSEFYLSGILAAVSKWITNPQMSIDQFIAFMIPSIFPYYEKEFIK